MSFTAREYRAMQYVASRRGWKLSLSARPWVYFTVNTGHDDATERLRITDILTEYDNSRREDARSRRQNKVARQP